MKWRDMIKRDLKVVRVDENDWYKEATTSRGRWKAICVTRLNQENAIGVTDAQVVCEGCLRRFCRESDKKRHKCIIERSKPIYQQKGKFTVQYATSGFIALVDSQYTIVDQTRRNLF